jgi:hypothetical protein
VGKNGFLVFSRLIIVDKRVRGGIEDCELMLGALARRIVLPCFHN